MVVWFEKINPFCAYHCVVGGSWRPIFVFHGEKNSIQDQ